MVRRPLLPAERWPVATFNQTHKPCNPGSIGFPIWEIEVKIINELSDEVEVGEVVISGHICYEGLFSKLEETVAAFKGIKWFHAADQGTKDEDGFFIVKI